MIYKITANGRPVPKSYGLHDGKMHKDKKVAEKEDEIAELFDAKHGKILKQCNFKLHLKIILPNDRRGDMKNYVFLVEDALEGHAYPNDRQIIEHRNQIRLNRSLHRKDGRTIIGLEERPNLDELGVQ